MNDFLQKDLRMIFALKFPTYVKPVNWSGELQNTRSISNV